MSVSGRIKSALRRLTPKGSALYQYQRTLPYRLRADYGHLGPYTPAQVDQTIRRYRIGNDRYVPYAVAMFADGKALPDFWNGRRIQPIRDELSSTYFDGEPFSYQDVLSHYGDQAGHCGDTSAHAGGDHAHDGSGGHH